MLYKDGEQDKPTGSVGQLKVKKEDEIIIKINQDHKNKLEAEKREIKLNKESVRDATPTPRDSSVPKGRQQHINAKLDPINNNNMQTPEER